MKNTVDIKNANALEKQLKMSLTLLGVNFAGSDRLIYNGEVYRPRSMKCSEAAVHFGGPHRALRLLRLFEFVSYLSCKPGNEHWWGFLSSNLTALAEQFPALSSYVWKIENGCYFHSWLRISNE